MSLDGNEDAIVGALKQSLVSKIFLNIFLFPLSSAAS